MENQVEDVQRAARRWMEEIWRPENLSSFDELHAEDFVDHAPAARASGRAAYRLGIMELFAVFPDFTAQIDDLLVYPAAGKAAIRWCASGTHRQAFMRFPARGRVVRFSSIEILRIQAGRILEGWGEWDALSIIEQMKGESYGV